MRGAGRRRTWLIAGASALAACTPSGASELTDAVPAPAALVAVAPPPHPGHLLAALPPPEQPEPVEGADAAVAAPAPGRPRTVRLAAIGVEAPVIDLGLDEHGALEVPDDFSPAGWWSGGTRPGDAGPAVIVGHIDSYTGPAIFYRLAELVAGDRVSVTDERGRTAVFEVVRSERYDKDEFPTELVYGPTDGPELRLVTCGGDFDHRARSYLANHVVFARLVPDAAGARLR